MSKSLNDKLKSIARGLRRYRKLHIYFGLFFSIFILISSLTGLLLAWKKQSVWLQPSTQTAENFSDAWLNIDSLIILSNQAIRDHLKSTSLEKGSDENFEVDRLDIRPDKNIAKVLFSSGNWEVQLDGKTGAILSVAKRRSDLIEQIHDGSIVSEVFKNTSMTMLSLGLIFSVISGIWLWYGPRKMRSIKRGRGQ